MATTGVGKDQILKAQRLDREWLAEKNRKKQEEFNNYDEYDKLDYELAGLKNTISLANYDLSTSLGKNNQSILRKKQVAEKRMSEILPRFEELKLQRLNKSKNKKIKK